MNVGFWEIILIFFILMVLFILPSFFKEKNGKFSKLRVYGLIFGLFLLILFLAKIVFMLLSLIALIFIFLLVAAIFLIKRLKR